MASRLAIVLVLALSARAAAQVAPTPGERGDPYSPTYQPPQVQARYPLPGGSQSAPQVPMYAPAPQAPLPPMIGPQQRYPLPAAPPQQQGAVLPQAQPAGPTAPGPVEVPAGRSPNWPSPPSR